ncbi:MAG TPA: TIGR03668 family PPOX class F420-dependent oxidoreductase [Candidatus Limnocylindrales bacterium]|nr:TIGR03668 family PPOX class F420-dependent oxidoreductase [Candidatus Limnocylindrales bacterium]
MPPLPPDEARRRLAAARIAYLATVRADGGPHVVPIVFAVDGDEIYGIADPKPKRGLDLLRHRNIAVNPAVSLLVDEYEESWERIWWVRADGEARIVDAGADRDRAIDLLRAKYSQYATWTEPFGAAMVMRVGRVTSWTI